jgi:hypothetical protein
MKVLFFAIFVSCSISVALAGPHDPVFSFGIKLMKDTPKKPAPKHNPKSKNTDKQPVRKKPAEQNKSKRAEKQWPYNPGTIIVV